MQNQKSAPTKTQQQKPKFDPDQSTESMSSSDDDTKVHKKEEGKKDTKKDAKKDKKRKKKERITLKPNSQARVLTLNPQTVTILQIRKTKMAIKLVLLPLKLQRRPRNVKPLNWNRHQQAMVRTKDRRRNLLLPARKLVNGTRESTPIKSRSIHDYKITRIGQKEVNLGEQALQKH